LAALAFSVISASCAQRSLVNLDVTGDAPFDAVSLRFTANNTAAKVFSSVTFSATQTLKVGLYLPDTISGAVTIAANATDSSGRCIGHGEVLIASVTPGVLGPATPLLVTHTTDCGGGPVDGGGGGISGAMGGAVGTGGQTGTGGVTGGTGGVSGGTGGVSGGTGGVSGGTGGAGGQPVGNLIVNGDFSAGVSSWQVSANTCTNPNFSVNGNGAACVSLNANCSLTIGYPSGATAPFQITAGVSYQFSYQASSTGGVNFEAKIGQTMPPYDATNSDFANEPIGAPLATHAHTFMRPTTDSMMGIGFNLAAGGAGTTVCIDNVSVMAN
jgi:hypothetical protein